MDDRKDKVWSPYCNTTVVKGESLLGRVTAKVMSLGVTQVKQLLKKGCCSWRSIA